MSDETRVRLIPIERIRIVNPRSRDKVKFQRVVESIGRIGLKRPITVTVGPPGEDGEAMYDLVCGQGRIEAFTLLGQKEIPALVRGFSKNEAMVASLVENIARRRVRSLDQVQMIEWMRQQGQPTEEIARKTGLSEEYVRHILRMLSSGEERILESVLNGKLPVTIAMSICGSSDEEAQRLLADAYERKEFNQKTLATFRRIVDLRKHLGRQYGRRGPRVSHRTSAENLVIAYRQETQRQRLMVKKAKLCEARLLSTAAAFKVLVRDDDWVNLLRAEKMETMPKFLAERARQVA